MTAVATAVIGVELTESPEGYFELGEREGYHEPGRNWWVDGWGEILHISINGSRWDVALSEVADALQAHGSPRKINA